ncbi:protein transport protein bos1 [Rhizoclosmatium sp. JEL0117]|nr:protein transport protein bos1 [Rhizoclosmatium sp. JEL0117]
MATNLIYNNASKVLSVLQTDIEQMQQQVDSGSTYSPVAGQIHSNLEALRQSAKDLTDIAKREITTVKREKALARANQVQADYQALKLRYDGLRKRQADVAAERNRTELLGGAVGGSGLGRRAAAHAKNAESSMTDTSAILMMDGLMDEHQKLTGAESRIDEFITMGRGALSELYEQRQILKSTQKRMYDIATSLGMSSTVIKYIEKRASQDRWILFGGMFVVVLLMWVILHFFGRK